jgi:hypothetical protein
VSNREQWLSEAVVELTPILKRHKLELAPNVRVSCGFPSKGGASKERRITGETWPAAATFDNSVQIFVTPLEDNPTTVLGILIREMVHASLPDDEGCGPNFKAACKEIGLEGRAKNMTPGLDLIKRLDEVADKLGEYPNKHIILAEKEKLQKPKKKSTFKLFCPHKRLAHDPSSVRERQEGCDHDNGLQADSEYCAKKCHIIDQAVGEDYSVSVSVKKLKLGFPLCVCGHDMILEEEDFKNYTDLQNQEG